MVRDWAEKTGDVRTRKQHRTTGKHCNKETKWLRIRSVKHLDTSDTRVTEQGVEQEAGSENRHVIIRARAVHWARR